MTFWADTQFWIQARLTLYRSVRAYRCGAFITHGGETRLFWHGDWYGWVGMAYLYPHALWINLDMLYDGDALHDAGASGQAAA